MLLVQAKDFQLNCGQSQGLVKLIMAGLLNSAAGGPSLRGMDATSEDFCMSCDTSNLPRGP